MPENNISKVDFVLKDLDEAIKREEDIIGINTDSVLKGRINFCNELIESYDPAIKGLDNKIVSIGQSINIIKNEIITLITAAVGVSTVNTCGIVDTSRCSIGGTSGWTGGISTCLTGYTAEYYDSVSGLGWAFSTTSTSPFESSTSGILNSSSSSFTVGLGTFLGYTQNNSSYAAGFRVSLGSSATCQTTATEITRKDGEITALRSEIQDYIGVVNKIRERRWKAELEKWGSLRAISIARSDRDTLIGIKTAFTDSRYNSLFLK
jgi:hypothetical protein